MSLFISFQNSWGDDDEPCHVITPMGLFVTATTCQEVLQCSSLVEALLFLARQIKAEKGLCIPSENMVGPAQHARIALALKLDSQSQVFKFRAMAEEWDVLRLNREMY
jgi:hypothetical protein